MSDSAAAALGPVLAYAVIAFLRGLARPARTPIDLTPRLRRVIPPPSNTLDVSESSATLQHKWPLPSEGPLVVPAEPWRREDELLGWRFWKLGRLPADGAIRLTSFRAPWAWDGPVLRAHRIPSESPFSLTGVYALKGPPPRSHDVHWSEDCWVSGWVALSGRVVEHERGFRAERAAIRRLRLGVGTHLHVHRMEEVRALAALLERRYQAPVNLGMVERRFVARILESERHLWREGIPELAERVRVG